MKVSTPARGDLIAGLSVALVLVPQSMAYAELAGLDPVHGLYTAAAAPLAGALVGSSRYLQTGPVAVTSLLTLGALAPLAEPETVQFAALAALLALFVGLVSIAIGALGGGPVAYLMSQPVVTSFTVAAATLIVASQVPGLLGVAVPGENPVFSATAALSAPRAWQLTDLLIGVLSLALVLGSRRISPLIPGALIAVVFFTAWSVGTGYDGQVVGELDATLGIHLGLPFESVHHLLLPGVLIALVGFAEPASIARRYAAEDRTLWNSNREFIGQGLANVAAGAVSGYPAGGSFSRTALNRLSGARSRWSGFITGLTVLLLLPFTGLLADMPNAVLAGLVIAAAWSLIDLRSFALYWRWSKPQFTVAVLTVVATIGFAPRVERGVMLGVDLALAVHLWRELNVQVPYGVEGDTLTLWPKGVLYFGSAPSLERTVNGLVGSHPGVSRVVVHVGGLGRVDLSGALVLRDLVEDLRAAEVPVEVRGAEEHASGLLQRVLGDIAEIGPRDDDPEASQPR